MLLLAPFGRSAAMNKNRKEKEKNNTQMRYTKKNYKIIEGPRNLFELR